MGILIYSTTQVSRRVETEEGLLKPQDKSFHGVFHVRFCLIAHHSTHDLTLNGGLHREYPKLVEFQDLNIIRLLRMVKMVISTVFVLHSLHWPKPLFKSLEPRP